MMGLLTNALPGNILPYCILGLAAMVEGPVTILFAGAAISTGQLLPFPVYLSVVLGNLTADLGWYSLGHFGKLEWLERIAPKAGVDSLTIEQLGKNIQKNGPRLLFLSKFTVGLPIPTLITIGLHRVAMRRWIILLILGELLKSAALLMVGFLYAEGIQQAYSGVQIILWTITIVLIAAITFYLKRHKKVKRSCPHTGISPISEEESSKRTNEMTQIKNLRGLVLIPAYNEERSVASIVRSALVYLPVLVVDDGSTDETAQRARLAGATVLSNRQNQGKGTALQAGFKQAVEQGYDFVITLDADGQHDPNEIPLFLKAYNSRRLDLIIGRRDFSLMPPVRRMSNILGTRIFSWAARKPIPDNQSGYRLVSQRLLKVLREPGERGYEFEVEMIVICILRRYRMKWIPIRTIYADEKSHIHPLHHMIKFMQVSLRARRLLKKSI